jgi:hydroxymethylpyrimidine/phosphomethylpyrimidine kinase
LLPDWAGERNPSARDIAKAAADLGVPYTLVTGIPLPDQFIENVLATPLAVLYSEKFERFEAVFAGAGETLSAALCALLANGHDLQAATSEALTYLDHSLEAGFHPGMGHIVPDRLFWAQSDDDAEESGDEAEEDPTDDVALTLKPTFDLPPNGTLKH